MKDGRLFSEAVFETLGRSLCFSLLASYGQLVDLPPPAVIGFHALSTTSEFEENVGSATMGDSPSSLNNLATLGGCREQRYEQRRLDRRSSAVCLDNADPQTKPADQDHAATVSIDFHGIIELIKHDLTAMEERVIAAIHQHDHSDSSAPIVPKSYRTADR